jgi:DUF1365 family protein
MPRSEKIEAAQAVVSQASTALTLDLVEEIAEPLAEFMVGGFEAEDWQDSPLVEALERVAALLEVDGREVPDAILEALKMASEAGRPVGVA